MEFETPQPIHVVGVIARTQPQKVLLDLIQGSLIYYFHSRPKSSLTSCALGGVGQWLNVEHSGKRRTEAVCNSLFEVAASIFRLQRLCLNRQVVNLARCISQVKIHPHHCKLDRRVDRDIQRLVTVFSFHLRRVDVFAVLNRVLPDDVDRRDRPAHSVVTSPAVDEGVAFIGDVAKRTCLPCGFGYSLGNSGHGSNRDKQEERQSNTQAGRSDGVRLRRSFH